MRLDLNNDLEETLLIMNAALKCTTLSFHLLFIIQ